MDIHKTNKSGPMAGLAYAVPLSLIIWAMVASGLYHLLNGDHALKVIKVLWAI